MPVMNHLRKADMSFSFQRRWCLPAACLRSFLAVLVLWSCGAHAQQVRLEGIGDLGYGWSRAFVDQNGDGRDDFCALVGTGSQLDCYMSNGTTFGPAKQSFHVGGDDTPGGMRWVDLNGDGQLDTCRYTAAIPAQFSCRFGPQLTTGMSFTIPVMTRFTVGIRALKDVYFTDLNGDGRADLCYIVRGSSDIGPKELRCQLANGNGFDAVTASWTRPNFDDGAHAAQDDPRGDWPRGFYDIDGDGYPDFCRISTSNTVRCTRTGIAGFVDEFDSPVISVPYKEGAAFVDMNADGKTDFCRVIGVTGNYSLRCLLANGVGWHSVERSSTVLDPGSLDDRYWIDINADGLADFCRARANNLFSCRLSRGDGDGTNAWAFAFSDVEVPNVIFGNSDGGRTFCDATGSGIPTLCRVTVRVQPGTPSEVCVDGESTWCYTVSGDTPIYGAYAGIKDDSASTAGSPQLLQARQPLTTGFSDGAGAETRLTYLPMSSTDVYTRSGPGSYPRALIAQPRSQVVYETRVWRAGTQVALTGNARYFYKDLRHDTWLGSRGFRDRWIFTEASNTLDHVVHYQGLGPGVDASSVLDDQREIGLMKYQERFAVANGVLPSPANAASLSPRQSFLKAVTDTARKLSAVAPTPPNATSPFLLLSSTTNLLSDTTPSNPRYRYLGQSTTKTWDLNNSTSALVPLPTVQTTTAMTDLGNVTSVVQVTDGGWRRTTTNRYDADNATAWLLGRLTKSTVTSEAPTADSQLALHTRSPGRSPGAGDMSSSLPAVKQPISPALLSAILQLLLDD